MYICIDAAESHAAFPLFGLSNFSTRYLTQRKKNGGNLNYALTEPMWIFNHLKLMLEIFNDIFPTVTNRLQDISIAKRSHATSLKISEKSKQFKIWKSIGKTVIKQKYKQQFDQNITYRILFHSKKTNNFCLGWMSKNVNRHRM